MNSTELKDLLELSQTPAYVFDIDMLRKRVEEIRNLSGSEIGLCYAVKANPFLVETMSVLTDRIEVCSPGELEICISKQLPPEKLLISGVNKTADFVGRALEYGVRHFTAESAGQMELLQKRARDFSMQIQVILRLTSGNQFGMDVIDLEKLIAKRSVYSQCEITGLHYFAGTQRSKLRSHRRELEKLSRLMDELQEKYGFETGELEYGPGLYFPYFDNEPEEDLSLYREFTEVLQEISLKCRITIEMGRYFTSSCGYYLTSVNDVKMNSGQNIAIVDGGINHLNYYGGTMGMRVPRLQILRGKADAERPVFYGDSDDAASGWMICGSLCTTADVLIRDLKIDDLYPGDTIVFENVGAYSMTEGLSLFLSRALPQVYLYEAGELRMVRETVESWKNNSIKEIENGAVN